MAKWDKNNPEDSVTPKDVDNMTDQELAQWDKDCDEFNKNEGR